MDVMDMDDHGAHTKQQCRTALWADHKWYNLPQEHRCNDSIELSLEEVNCYESQVAEHLVVVRSESISNPLAPMSYQSDPSAVLPEKDAYGGDNLPTYDELAAQHGPNSRYAG